MSTQNQQIMTVGEGVKSVLTELKKRERQLRMALPKYITVEKWIGVVSRSIQNNPKLLACTPQSLYACIFQAAQLGLECDGVMHEAYLVPYKVRGVMTVTLIPGFPGYLKLVRNSGQLAKIGTAAVWPKDEFEFEYGTDSFLKHKPSPEPPEKGDLPIAFWCVAILKDGSPQFEVMWPWQVNRIRDKSQAYRYAVADNRADTPWIEHYDEMGRKTALIRVCKMLPKSTELARAMRLEEQAEAGEPQEFDFMDISAADITGQDGDGKALPATGSKLDAIVDASKGNGKDQAPKTTPPPAQPQQSAVQEPPKSDKPKGAKTTTRKQEEYADSEPDPFAPGGDMFGREPGMEG